MKGVGPDLTWSRSLGRPRRENHSPVATARREPRQLMTLLLVVGMCALAFSLWSGRTDAPNVPSREAESVASGLYPGLGSGGGEVDEVLPSRSARREGTILVSERPDRSGARSLRGQRLSGDLYIFVRPAESIDNIVWSREGPGVETEHRSKEQDAPYDLAGTAPGGTAFSWQPPVDDGYYTVQAQLSFKGGEREVRTASFEWEEAQPEASARHTGLHFTEAERRIWRARATSGPYREGGDENLNSPGDWQRIVDNMSEFMDAPGQGRTNGPSGGAGLVRPDPDDQFSGNVRRRGARVRDAAFYYLVTGDRAVREAVKTELIAQARMPGMDFNDESRWRSGLVYDVNPNFQVSHFMAEHLYAYDYLGRASFSRSEQELLDEWHRGFADLMRYDSDSAFEEAFTDRRAGILDADWLDEHSRNPSSPAGYEGGPRIGPLAQLYNNRRMQQMRYVALVGVLLQDDQLKWSAKQSALEFLKYGVYPDGSFSDLHRSSEDQPEAGLQYSAQLLAAVVTIADVLARDGDVDVYRFVTSDGAQGTQGAPSGYAGKSLLFALRSLGRYIDGTYDRYAAGAVASEVYRIDGREPFLAHAAMVAQANVYYKDSILRSIYRHELPGMPPYPSEPLGGPGYEVWNGDAGIYPGVLFMFGDMEGQVWPYPAAAL